MQLTGSSESKSQPPQRTKAPFLISFFLSLAVTGLFALVISIPQIPEWLGWPVVVGALPGISVWWMTYGHGWLRFATIFFFNWSFYLAAIFGVSGLIRYNRSRGSLQPVIGVASLVILMIFVSVFNSGNRWVLVHGHMLNNYPGWPIYLFGVLAASLSGFRGSKGWIYLLPFLCVGVSVAIPTVVAMLYIRPPQP